MMLSSLPLFTLFATAFGFAQEGQEIGAGGEQRKLDFTRIVGYEPRSQVTDQNALDLDQSSFAEELFLGKVIKARKVYAEGGHSASYAVLTLTNPHGPANFSAGTEVVGIASTGQEVAGRLEEHVSWGNQTGNQVVKVVYLTSEVQEKYVGCQVGGLYAFSNANLDGCFNNTGHVSFIPKSHGKDGRSYHYNYDIRVDNKNARTLQLLSTEADKTMKKDGGDCEVCPYIDDFQKFVDYYGDTSYADKWIMAASYNKSTDFSSGRGEAVFSVFAHKEALAAAQAKGSVLMSVFMEVIRSMESAITGCEKAECSREECKDQAVSALDAAVAFYAGSLQGDDGSGDGKMLYDATNRMALHFATCGDDGTDEVGEAWINGQIVSEFQKFQLHLLHKNCDESRKSKEIIVNFMKVPLVQGVLQYAYVRQFENPELQEYSEQSEAEGATFAAAILPYVNACNSKDADTVYENMKIGSSPSKVRFADVKAALERNYACMGITCTAVGGVWTVNGYAEGAEPCTFASTSSSSSAATSAGGIAAITIATVFGLMLFGYLYLRASVRRRAAKMLRRSAGNIAAVSEIS